ncbi:MAG TPA: hypothetical protein VNW46_09655, partial [Gemmatimonadaceae bacterium]|jgi:hypothetical protein|nr:hypothetical protein [Gemmatimonadaceae bacterium]
MPTTDTRMRRTVIRARIVPIVLAGLGLAGCRPSDVLSVPPPIGVIGGTTLHNVGGAETELAGATAQLADGISGSSGLIELSGLLTDEFGWTWYSSNPTFATIDARFTAATGAGSGGEQGDTPLNRILTARSNLLITLAGLRQFEPSSGQSKVGEAYALIGYAELVMAEDYCAGVPLSVYVPGGGIQYGTPLTTDSLLGTAEAHFALAAANAGGNDTVMALGGVGLGRTRLDRGNFAGAAAAVASVPTGFVYNLLGGTTGSTGNPNLYETQLPANNNCGAFNISEREGGTGLNFVSARDPRLLVDSTIAHTCDGGTWYYPAKFGNPSISVPLATGVEARLIEAEAALHTPDVPTWTADLNALRGDAANTGVTFPDSELTITSDSTTGASAAAQVDVMFRERAFWLFGTGIRQSDLRRLIRQYGRDQSTVFPTGPFANGHNPNLPLPLPSYGTDVSFTLPTAASGNTTSNPYYKGCLTPTSAG